MGTQLRIASLVALLGLSAALCPSNSFAGSDGYCYISVNSTNQWSEALDICQLLNANLVVPRNAFDNAAFSGVVQSFQSLGTWLGAFSDGNATWYDVNGTRITYDRFAPGQRYSNNACASMAPDGNWYADGCQYVSAFICRISDTPVVAPTTRPPVPTTTTTTTRLPTTTTTRPVVYNYTQSPVNPSNCPGYTTLYNTNPCPYGWHFLLKTCSCYLMTTNTYSWFEAEQYCTSKQSHLTSLHNPEEALYVMSLSTISSKLIYVGLQNIGGNWLWSDGTPVDFLNWAPRGFNADTNKNACGYVLGDGYYFASYMGNGPCTTKFSHAVCKKRLN